LAESTGETPATLSSHSERFFGAPFAIARSSAAASETIGTFSIIVRTVQTD